MRSNSSSRLRRNALVGFLALDLLGLLALLADQLFSANPAYPWLIALGLVMAALPMLVQAADYVLTPPQGGGIVPNAGEKIP
ncbi:MAG: hypothetical protein EOP93_16405 [Lysobacteraceae bacterium]|nr:MAG: hypothetical protein EOP93_16405 [Xanthomonadaceae bacterium]